VLRADGSSWPRPTPWRAQVGSAGAADGSPGADGVRRPAATTAGVDRRCQITAQRFRPACAEPIPRGHRSPGEPCCRWVCRRQAGVENLALRGRVRSSSRPPATHAGDPTHHEHRTGDNSLPGDPGVPVDLQTSADPVLLDWTNWIDAGSRPSSPPCGFSPSAALTTTATPSRTTPSLAPYVGAVTAAHPALRGQLQDPGPDYLPCGA
jgi:hypothetical protein